MPKNPKKLFVIDAMAMAFRNFHAFGANQLTTKEGIPTSAVFGSANFLLKLVATEKPDYLIIASDSKEKTFRHDLYPQYKANRTEMPEDLAVQLPYLFRLFDGFSCPILIQPGVEADDLIGSLACKYASPDVNVYIVSGDKDFMQLINPHVFLYSPKKNSDAIIVDEEKVFEKFGCKPDQVIDILGLMGDSADNVPGVKGIGEKGAAKLIHEFGTIENIYKHLDKVTNKRALTALTESEHMALLSKELVTIKTDLDITPTLEDMKCDVHNPPKIKELEKLFTELEFRNLLNQLNKLKSETSDNQDTQQVIKSIESKNSNYKLVQTNEDLEKLLTDLENCDEFVFDTETTGLHCIEDKAIGISFCTQKDHAWYIPLIKNHMQAAGYTAEDAIAKLKPIFANPGKRKIAHNLKFDMQMLYNIGIHIAPTYVDTMIISYLLNPIGRSNKLDDCCLEYLNYKKIKTTSLKDAKNKINMVDAPIDQLSIYACEDADLTFQLYKKIFPMLESSELIDLFTDIEMPLIPVLAEMEQTGVFIDSNVLNHISEDLAAKIKVLQNEIYKHAGSEFNINSTKQLREIMYDRLKIHEELGVKKIKKTKSGLSTDVSVLEKLSTHPLAKALLEYRTYSKLKNTYVDTLPQLISSKSNRIHTSFHQTGTATGRLSSSDPNLQNIPIRTEAGRQIRKAFRAQEEDWFMVSADYSQVELRILAHIAQDPGLISAFNSNEDIHTSTAIKIFGNSAEGNSDLRSKAKSINFGIIYGMGPQRLSRQTGVTLKEAKEFIEKYFESFPAIKNYIESAKNSAREYGFTRTILGRKRPVPEIRSDNPMTRVNGENIAVNSPIQGSAADIIKLAMINIHRELTDIRLEGKLLLQVHDELVLSCPPKEIDEVKKIVQNCMENAVKLDVPLLVEIGHGQNWLEAH